MRLRFITSMLCPFGHRNLIVLEPKAIDDAKLSAETPGLQARHAGNPVGFAAAHAARKKELVGQAALETTGCTAK